MLTSTEEKNRTNSNIKSEILEARVIANYGDPGIDEDYHFDFLSRYIIVMIESSLRVPTQTGWTSMLAVVKRPKSLWINVEGSVSTPTTQKRSDNAGNVSTGLASGYSIAGIQGIDKPYQMGELIKIKKLPVSLKTSESALFISAFPYSNPSVASYLFYAGNNHTQGSQNPYITNTNPNALKQKTFIQGSDSFHYIPSLNKFQYEAFALQIASNLNNGMVKLFSNVLPASHPAYSANGGYLFNNNPNIIINATEYEDMNIGNKQRGTASECLPLIVAAPSSFPTPRVRAIGTIAYNPSYATVASS